MFEAAIRYPTTGDRAVERLLIGGVLVFLSFLIVPIVLVYGYLVRSLAAVADGEAEPPAFDDWAGLLVDGLKAILVAAAYAVVPFALVVSFLVPVSVVTSASAGDDPGVMAGLGAVAFLVIVVVTLAVAYVVMAALSRFAVEGRLRAAFELRAVGRLALSEPYVIAIVLAIAVQVLLGIVVAAAVLFTLGLALLPLVPLGAFIQFWLYLVVVHLFGSAYREAVVDGAAA